MKRLRAARMMSIPLALVLLTVCVVSGQAAEKVLVMDKTKGAMEANWDPTAGHTILADVAEIEPDNNTCPGQAFSCGDVLIPAEISPGGDVDRFYFTANAGDFVTFGTDANGTPTADTFIKIYDANCTNILASDDDSGPGDFSLLTFCIPATGTYVGVVRGFSGSTTGKYKAFLTCEGSGGFGDNCATATLLECGDVSLAGHTKCSLNDYTLPDVGSCLVGTSTNGPDQVFKLVVEAGGSVNLTYTSSSNGSIYILRDCADLTTCEAGVDATGAGQAETLQHTFTNAGTYYLILDSSGINSVGTWTLTGTLDCGTPPPPVPEVVLVTPLAPEAIGDCCHEVSVQVSNNLPAGTGANIRGISTTFTLENLELCSPIGQSITEGTYLSSAGSAPTSFIPRLNLDGSYTVDVGILGVPCGAAPGSEGILFKVKVRPVGTQGPFVLHLVNDQVHPIVVRNCVNGVLANQLVDGDVTIPSDLSGPGPVTGLTAVQLGSADDPDNTVNDADGTTKIRLTFTPPGDADFSTVELWRKGFGGYPRYDDDGGAVPTPPSSHGQAVSEGWVLVGDVTSPYEDEPSTRDFWYYVAYAKDDCGNVSDVSEMTGGTLNYHLGDVASSPVGLLANGCGGDNVVNDDDISFLGVHYGSCWNPPVTDTNDPGCAAVYALADALDWICLDVGPTTSGYVDGLPTTDGRVNFEDFMMFLINYGQVSAPQTAPIRIATSGFNTVSLRVPAMPPVGGEMAVALNANAIGDLQGLSARLDYDHTVVRFLGVQAGPLLGQQVASGHALTSADGVVDVGVVGSGSTIQGQGDLAYARFRVLAARAPGIELASITGRDVANRGVTINSGVVGVDTRPPASTQLAPASPNPFDQATMLSYALAQPGRVDLVVYGVDGRRVRTLVSEVREAGVYQSEWNGRDDDGRALHAGVYYVRLTTVDSRHTRALVLR